MYETVQALDQSIIASTVAANHALALRQKYMMALATNFESAGSSYGADYIRALVADDPGLADAYRLAHAATVAQVPFASHPSWTDPSHLPMVLPSLRGERNTDEVDEIEEDSAEDDEVV